QAEDGIRDFQVTGVQTCALPISVRRRRIEGHFYLLPFSFYLSLHPSLSPLPKGIGEELTCIVILERIKSVPKAYLYHTYSVVIADRKSTRLNSSHVKISYAVFCL